MAELIDKGAVVARLRMIGAFEYNDTRRNAFKEILDMLEAQPTTTEAEIRASAIDEFCTEAIKHLSILNNLHGYVAVADCEDVLKGLADKLKECESNGMAGYKSFINR